MHGLNTLKRLNSQAAPSNAYPDINHPSRAIEKFANAELKRELELRGFSVERKTV